MMNFKICIVLLFMIIPLTSNAQDERKFVRKGVKAYDEKTYPESEIAFRKALDADSTSVPAGYDMGNALYKQNKYKDASGTYEQLAAAGKLDNSTLADVYHNLGNSLLKQGDYQNSIEAYKKSLRLRPGDNETRYNLVYAQSKLREQQQQQQQNNKNQNNKDQKNQDKNKQQDQKNKEQQKNQQQQDKQQQNQQNQQEKQQNQDKDQNKKTKETPEAKRQLSKEEVRKMLQAIQQQELMTLEKYKIEKAQANRIRTDKDW